MSAPDLWAAGALPRALFEQSPFSTVIYDAAGRPLAANAAFTALWGVTLDQVPAEYTVLADVQLERQGVLPLVRRAFAGAAEHVVTPPVCFDMTKVSTTGAGRTVWTQGHWYPVRDADGRLTHVVLVHADITERVQAEQTIRQGEERLRLAQQVAHIGTFDWHVPSGRIAWTEEEERLFGIAPGTFEGTIDGWARFVLPEDAAATRSAMAAAMARGDREMDLTFRIRRPDGEVRHIEGRGAFLYAADGTPERMVGVNVDVTDRRRAEEELARNERALRAAADRTARLQQVTAAFARALTAEEIARVTLDEGLAALGAQSAIVYLADAEGRRLAAASTRGLEPGALGPWTTVDADGPTMTADALRAGAPRYVQTRAERVARYPATRDVGVPHEAWAVLPLLQDGRRLGAIAVGFVEPHALPAEERAFVEAIARQCAQALERARLYEAERSARRAAEASARRLAALQRATAELTATLTPREVVDAVMRTGLPAVGATRGSVAVLSDDGSAVEVVGAAGYPDDVMERYRRVPLDEPFPLADVVRTGEALFLSTVEARAERYPHLGDLRRGNGAGAMATLPLRAGGRAFGAIGLNWADTHPFTEEERAFLHSLAQQCAQALERARLYEEERKARANARAAADRLQTVADAARVLNERSLDPDAMVDALADILARRLGDECVVRLATEDGEWLEPGAVRHPDPERQALLVSLHTTERYHVTDGLTGVVYRSGESLLVPEVDRDALRASLKPAYRPWVERLGMYSVLCVPLRGRASTLGTVWLSRDEPGRPYRADDLALVEDVAGRAGLLLERARLYAAERRARTEAEEASRAKSDFLAAMSHELRTPLNGIGGYVELIEMGIRGPVTDEQRADLERIRRNQRHLLALIEDVLSFARVEAGRLEVERVPVPVEETLQSLEALVHPQMASQGLAFVYLPCDPGLVAVGDRERIVQVCVNLLTNAVKATPRGGSVTLWCEADEGTVRVRVRDTGVGIPADKLEAIFSPFTQLGRTLSNPRAGAGLGLSISRGLAEAMGGSLAVESVEGEGSTFTLALRRA